MRSAAKGTEPDATQLDDALVELERLARLVSPALRDLRAEAAAFPAMRQEIADLQKENAALRDLANQFHAEADHNGRHWEASRFMVGHLTGELAEARAEAERFRTEAEGVLGLRNEIGRAETRAIRQQVQNRELVQALETERHRGERLHKEAAETNARLDTLEREAAETARLRDDAVAVALANAARLEADRRSVLDAEIETLQRRVDELQQQASAQSALLTEQELGLAASREREAELRLRLEAIQTQKDRMVASASWKATRPLRVAAKRLKALTKGQP
jgi:chromosome segregation ATPase